MILRCDQLMPSGQPCGRPLGRCIHWYIPTRFGTRHPATDAMTTQNSSSILRTLFGRRHK